ncbi:hypothetical protein N42_0276 [Lactococcus lactis subsp. lactis]|uniref:Uncharacterized protein n=1 Tax=Lactococcus lactis subsp. lactis TaxID=1360 RepID=A0A0V8EVS3_LACLL|nr:hypothetical protein N42_0276 [Lactococcus lactis subsp. lactis]
MKTFPYNFDSYQFNQIKKENSNTFSFLSSKILVPYQIIKST